LYRQKISLKQLIIVFTPPLGIHSVNTSSHQVLTAGRNPALITVNFDHRAGLIFQRPSINTANFEPFTQEFLQHWPWLAQHRARVYDRLNVMTRIASK
jgi:hypothetical protein